MTSYIPIVRVAEALFTVLVTPAKDVPGQWVAHCLQLDVVTQGDSISHAFGTVFDNPNLIALTIVGDGESETGPLATSWHSTKFLNPITDGAVLPVLHLNGYKVCEAMWAT